jgi:hypothetical protein
MKTLTSFLSEILPDVPGCTADMATNALRNTIIEFCEKSLCYRQTLDPITVQENITDYDLEPPKGYRVQKIMQMWYLGQEMEALAPDGIGLPDAYRINIAGYNASKGPPAGYTQKDVDTFSILPIPDQKYTNAITMRVALVPLRTVTEVEDFLFELWGEIIGFGAKARLMLTPGKPYSNSEAATYNQARFVSGLNDARQRAARGNVRSDLRVQLRKP